MSDDANIEITDPAFARRFANLLIGARRRECMSHRHLARKSPAGFSRAELQAFESGSEAFSPDVVDDLCALYDVDVAAILPLRLTIEVVGSELRTGGLSRRFEGGDVTSMLTTYLELVRELRCQARAAAVPLRRDDVLALARHVGQSGEWLVQQLAALMGATRPRRTAMATAFASGAAIIGLVGGAAASDGTGPAATTVWPAPSSTAPQVQDETPTTAAVIVVPVAVPPTTDAPATTAPETVTTLPVAETSPATAPDVELVPVPAVPAPATTASAPATSPSSDVAPKTTITTEADADVDVGLPPLPYDPPVTAGLPSSDASGTTVTAGESVATVAPETPSSIVAPVAETEVVEDTPTTVVSPVVELAPPPVPSVPLADTPTTVASPVVALGAPPVPTTAANDATG